MLDRRQLAAFDALAPGQRIIAGCIVRSESNVRHAAVSTRRIIAAIVALVALPLSVLVLGKLGILWIGALFAIGPVIGFARRTTSGLAAKPKVFHAILTDHSLLLADLETEDAGPSVAYAFARSTLVDVRAQGRCVVITSAGRRIRLITDRADAQQMASLMQT